MTALRTTYKPVCVRVSRRKQCAGVATHQEATLLSLHFRSVGWTPCVSGPTLLAASAVMRSVQNPGAQWDAWFFHRGQPAASMPGRIGASRRARLHASAMVWAEGIPGAARVMVLEERTAPGTSRAGRRLVVELASDPFASGGAAPVDPRVIAAVGVLPARDGGQANPAPDLSVDLEALGLIAPRAESW